MPAGIAEVPARGKKFFAPRNRLPHNHEVRTSALASDNSLRGGWSALPALTRGALLACLIGPVSEVAQPVRDRTETF